MNGKQAQVLKPIPDLYKKSALSLLMFGFVVGAREAVPNLTVKAAIFMFMDRFELTHDDYNYQSALADFTRMQQSFINLN